MLLDTGNIIVKKTLSLNLQNLWSSRGDKHEASNQSMRRRDGSFPFILQNIFKIEPHHLYFCCRQKTIFIFKCRFCIHDNLWNCVVRILIFDYWFFWRLNMRKIWSSAMRNSPKKKLSNIISLILRVVAELVR